MHAKDKHADFIYNYGQYCPEVLALQVFVSHNTIKQQYHLISLRFIQWKHNRVTEN